MMFDDQWPQSQSASPSSSSNRPREGLLFTTTPEPLETAAPSQSSDYRPYSHGPYSLRQILLSSNNVHDFSLLLDADRGSVSCSHLANYSLFHSRAGRERLAPTDHTP